MSTPIDKPTLIKAGTIIRRLDGGTLYLATSEDVSPTHNDEFLTGRSAAKVQSDTWIVGDVPVDVEVIEPPSKEPKKAAPKKAEKKTVKKLKKSVGVVRKQRSAKKPK